MKKRRKRKKGEEGKVMDKDGKKEGVAGKLR